MVATQMITVVIRAAEAIAASTPTLFEPAVDGGRAVDRVDVPAQVGLARDGPAHACVRVDAVGEFAVETLCA